MTNRYYRYYRHSTKGNKMPVIYILRDPRTYAIRYVGQTVNPDRRTLEHEKNYYQCSPLKTAWIEELANLKLKPVFEVVEDCDHAFVVERERWWCSHFADEGCDLLNRPTRDIPVLSLTPISDLEWSKERLLVIKDELQTMLISLSPLLGTSSATCRNLEKAIDKLMSAQNDLDNRAQRKGDNPYAI